jgi:predicted RNA-binding Zn-ribbon protein involved in translation (DUF1610 family)
MYFEIIFEKVSVTRYQCKKCLSYRWDFEMIIIGDGRLFCPACGEEIIPPLPRRQYSSLKEQME